MNSEQINVKIKKLAPGAKIPAYTKPGDAGMDVVAVSKTETDKFIEYGTGLAFEIPNGYAMLVFPRSSVTNYDLVLANSVGLLDAGFRGELKLRFRKDGKDDYNIGDRIGQLIILPYPQVKFEEAMELSDSERGEGGFGSSGKS